MLHLLILSIGIIVGIIIGIIFSLIRLYEPEEKPIGNLVFNKSYPEDAPFLAVSNTSDLDAISRKKYVTLKVVSIKTNSQK